MKVLLFAQLREVLGQSELELDSNVANVGELRAELQARGERWAEFLAPGRALAAVNQTLADDKVVVGEGDEIAFFPPVTGG